MSQSSVSIPFITGHLSDIPALQDRTKQAVSIPFITGHLSDKGRKQNELGKYLSQSLLLQGICLTHKGDAKAVKAFRSQSLLLQGICLTSVAL